MVVPRTVWVTSSKVLGHLDELRSDESRPQSLKSSIVSSLPHNFYPVGIVVLVMLDGSYLGSDLFLSLDLAYHGWCVAYTHSYLFTARQIVLYSIDTT
jgi:hypothetical protein